MIGPLRKGDVVARPGAFRLRWMGNMWLSQYCLQLEDGNGGWCDSSCDYFMDAEELTAGGFEYVGNDLEQMEMF